MQTAADEGDARDIDAKMTRQALEQLYNNMGLAGVPLARHLPAIRTIADPLQRTQALRRLLLEAIESLRPTRPAVPHLLASRTYEVLSLRYVSGLAVEEIAERLSVGQRQVYRDLRKGEEDLALLLPLRAGDGGVSGGDSESLGVELAALDMTAQRVDLTDLLRDGLETVRSLADHHHVTLVCNRSADKITVLTAVGPTRQALVQLLSAAVQSADGQEIRIALSAEQARAQVALWIPSCRTPNCISLLQSASSLAQAIGLDCQLDMTAAGGHVLLLTFAQARAPSVLIVEDNPGACALYQRYLEGTPWEVLVVQDMDAIEQVTADVHTAAVILDLIMPSMDGWSLLQRLRMNPRTASIPVIICSVVSDPELASTLGAAASLRKPVTRWELLETLQRVARKPGAA